MYYFAARPRAGDSFILMAFSMHGWPRPIEFTMRVGLWPASLEWFGGFMAACIGNVCVTFLTDPGANP